MLRFFDVKKGAKKMKLQNFTERKKKDKKREKERK